MCFSFHDFINHVASVTLSEREDPTEVTFLAKNVKKPLPWKIGQVLINDWVLPTFCPLFLLYRRRNVTFDRVFELFLTRGFWPPGGPLRTFVIGIIWAVRNF